MPQSDVQRVFINAPFDKAYEPLFITLVGTLVFLRQEPHCVLEVAETGAGRLARILDLMGTCRLSIHDLSRMGRPVRFNMPFELGLACAIQHGNPSTYDVFVMDAKPYRIDRTLSDYKGRDPLLHSGTCDGMQTCLLDVFRTVTMLGDTHSVADDRRFRPHIDRGRALELIAGQTGDAPDVVPRRAPQVVGKGLKPVRVLGDEFEI